MRKSCCETALFSLYAIIKRITCNYLDVWGLVVGGCLPRFFIQKKLLHLSPFEQLHRLTIELVQKTK